MGYPIPPSLQSSTTTACQGWNGQEEDPLASRFKYKVDETILRQQGASGLSHPNQLNENRNKVKWNNLTLVEPRNNQMTWEQVSDIIDVEDQEVLGKLCLQHTNSFRHSHGLSPSVWEPLMFKTGILI